MNPTSLEGVEVAAKLLLTLGGGLQHVLSVIRQLEELDLVVV
ncbi:MAG: hypothetical protein QW677_04785 [Pyrobaculum sp.]